MQPNPWLTIRDKTKSSRIANDMAADMDDDVASYVDDDVASYVDDDVAINTPNFNHFSIPVHSTVSNHGVKFITTGTSQF
jgi:hypothetical protein